MLSFGLSGSAKGKAYVCVINYSVYVVLSVVIYNINLVLSNELINSFDKTKFLF